MNRICLLGLPRCGSQYIAFLIAKSIKDCTELAEPFTKDHLYSIEENNKKVTILKNIKFSSHEEQIEHVIKTLKLGSLDQSIVMKLFLTESIIPFLKKILSELAMLNFKFVIIKRENIEHQILSWLIAKANDKWCSFDGPHIKVSVNLGDVPWLYEQISMFDKVIKDHNVDAKIIKYERAVLDLTLLLRTRIQYNILLTKQVTGNPYNLIENVNETRTYLKKLLNTQ
jgi:hypothetical protein